MHKKVEEPKAVDQNKPEESDSKIKLVDYDDEIKSNDSMEIKNIESDFVSIDKLKLLGIWKKTLGKIRKIIFVLLENSVELKEILANRHLKEILINLNSQEENIDEKVEKAMQEPLFQEFSAACLKVVQNQTDLEKFRSIIIKFSFL